MKKLVLVALLIASSSFAETTTPTSTETTKSVGKVVLSAVTSKYGKITGGLVAVAAAIGGAWVVYTKHQENQTKNN